MMTIIQVANKIYGAFQVLNRAFQLLNHAISRNMRHFDTHLTKQKLEEMIWDSRLCMPSHTVMQIQDSHPHSYTQHNISHKVQIGTNDIYDNTNKAFIPNFWGRPLVFFSAKKVLIYCHQ